MWQGKSSGLQLLDCPDGNYDGWMIMIRKARKNVAEEEVDGDAR